MHSKAQRWDMHDISRDNSPNQTQAKNAGAAGV